MLTSELQQTSNGIPYQDFTASSMGSGFILYPAPQHSPKDIKKAKAEIRANNDVVKLRVATEEDWDNLYLDAIFRHPQVKPLRWFEINQEMPLIRKERKKGTSPDEFVTNQVLPNIAQVTARNLEKFPEIKDQL